MSLEGCYFKAYHGGFLEGRAAKGYSQFGEEGLIAACLERYGEGPRTCVEIGAGDGEYLSNTAALRLKGWRTLLIECQEQFRKPLAALRSAKTELVFEAVPTGHRVDWLIDNAGYPTVTFCSLDIDGQEFWVWATMTTRPALMLVEFLPGRDEFYVPPFNPEPGRGGPRQATLPAILDLGKAKDYIPLCRTNVNVLFVAREVHER